MWHYKQQGKGRPLILLHGIGMSAAAWRPVMPVLAAQRRVIAFDTAGFGQTPPLAQGTAPTIPNLVESLVDTLRQMSLQFPVDIAGNSLGGYMALEAAKLGIARTVVAISPAGLWNGHTPSHPRYVFKIMRSFSKTFPSLTKNAMKLSMLREALLAIPMSIGSRRMSADDAIGCTQDFINATAFEDTFDQMGVFSGGTSINIPITIAFGTHDWLLMKKAQRQDELPAHTKWVRPYKWGHVPMWAHKQEVAQLILQGTQ